MPPKFWAVESVNFGLSESCRHIFLWENCHQKCKICSWEPHFEEICRPKIAILSSLSNVCSVCRKIATSCPAYFFPTTPMFSNAVLPGWRTHCQYILYLCVGSTWRIGYEPGQSVWTGSRIWLLCDTKRWQESCGQYHKQLDCSKHRKSPFCIDLEARTIIVILSTAPIFSIVAGERNSLKSGGFSQTVNMQADEKLFRLIKHTPTSSTVTTWVVVQSTPYLTRVRVGLHNYPSFRPKPPALTSVTLSVCCKRLFLLL